MAHQEYTLAPEERFTPEKAEAFVARYRPDLEALAAAVAVNLAGTSGARKPNVTLYSAEALMRRYPVRAKGVGIIRAGEVAYTRAGAMYATSIGLFVDWATERVFRL